MIGDNETVFELSHGQILSNILLLFQSVTLFYSSESLIISQSSVGTHCYLFCTGQETIYGSTKEKSQKNKMGTRWLLCCVG